MPKLIYLNSNRYMTPGAANRGPELTRLLTTNIFTPQDSAVISSRARAVAEAYPTLTRPARQVLLHPQIFPVFLGIKNAYIQFEEEPYTEQLSLEVCAIPSIGQKFGLFFTNAYTVNIPAFRERLDREGYFLSDNGCIQRDQVEFFRDNPVDREWDVRLTTVLQRHIQPSSERSYIHGFLMGYPAKDIEYATWMEKSGTLPHAIVISELFGNRMLSDANPSAFLLLKRWETAMRYGYGLLSHFPHFWDDLDVGLSNSLSLIIGNQGGFDERIVDLRIREEHPDRN